MIRDYVHKNFTGERNGQHPRVLLLVFRGPDAVEKIRDVVGHIVHERTSGETIRDTYGDYITDEAGKVTYFEPGVLASLDAGVGRRRISSSGRSFPTAMAACSRMSFRIRPGAKVEKTLVLIKPDNFKFPNIRPGGVIDVFSRTGLYIIGFKVHRMSVAQAEEFYGPVLAVLKDKLGADKGREAWEDIVEFMSGRRPSATSAEQRHAPGTEKCIAIVYQGEDAVRKIRDVLGPTDPTKAPPGSIRKEFGQTIMVNAAHASDSPENAKREMEIVQVRENNFKPLIENFYRAPIACAPLFRNHLITSTMEISTRAALTHSLAHPFDRQQSQGDEEPKASTSAASAPASPTSTRRSTSRRRPSPRSKPALRNTRPAPGCPNCARRSRRNSRPTTGSNIAPARSS